MSYWNYMHHTFFVCHHFEERVDLTATVGGNLSPDNIVRKMLQDENSQSTVSYIVLYMLCQKKEWQRSQMNLLKEGQQDVWWAADEQSWKRRRPPIIVSEWGDARVDHNGCGDSAQRVLFIRNTLQGPGMFFLTVCVGPATPWNPNIVKM